MAASEPPELPPSGAAGGPAPPSQPAVKLPRALRGRFQRDWRMAAEMVGKGSIHFTDKGVGLVGRRTSVLRGFSYFAFRFLAWVAFMAFSAGVLLTSVGIGWRWESCWLFLVGPIFLVPTAFVAGWVLRVLLRGRLEPAVEIKVPWERVRRLASDGQSVELEVDLGQGWVVGHLQIRGRSAYFASTLQAIREGRMPVQSEAMGRGLRSLWMDRILLWAPIGLAIGLGFWCEPWVSAYLMQENTQGALAGIPAALTPNQVEELGMRDCVPSPPDAPTIINKRQNDTLTWELAGETAGWKVLNARWRAGTRRIELVDGPGGAIPGFFRAPRELAISLVVPTALHDAVRAMLGSSDLDAIHRAWCMGGIGSMDYTAVSTDPPEASLQLTRDGSDLMVTVTGLRSTARILPVRRRRSMGWAPFDLCEVPQEKGQLGTAPATPTAHRFESFFTSERDEADVYLVETRKLKDVEILARGGTVQPCLVAESLVFAGLTLAYRKTGEGASSAARLRSKAALEARQAASLLPGAKVSDTMDALVIRAETLFANHPSGNLASLRLGWLDAIDWSVIIDNTSMQKHLPDLERTRQRLEGADPDGELGDDFLYALATAFLERQLPEFAEWNRRVDVAEAWLDIKPGTKWPGPIIVPQAASGTYQTIGLFMLFGVAQRLENDLNAGRLGYLDMLMSLRVRSRLLGHGVAISVAKSSKRKAFEAWIVGDFEYVLDRLLKKAQETLANEEKSVSAIRGSKFVMNTQWTNGSSVRFSNLQREGAKIGWVAQFVMASSQVRYSLDKVHLDTLKGQRPFVVTSATYAAPSGEPVGLSVQDGRVNNQSISPKFDGLVIIDKQRGVHMLDLRRGGVLPGETRRIRPRRIKDFVYLLNWLKKRKASAFQTHLLYADGKPRIELGRSSSVKRERRVLVRAAFQSNPILCVVNLPSDAGGYSLYETMAIVEQALGTPEPKGPGLQVIGIANLDVGSFDILEAQDDQGTQRAEGKISLSKANNLLLITL